MGFPILFVFCERGAFTPRPLAQKTFIEAGRIFRATRSFNEWLKTMLQLTDDIFAEHTSSSLGFKD